MVQVMKRSHANADTPQLLARMITSLVALDSKVTGTLEVPPACSQTSAGDAAVARAELLALSVRAAGAPAITSSSQRMAGCLTPSLSRYSCLPERISLPAAGTLIGAGVWWWELHQGVRDAESGERDAAEPAEREAEPAELG